VHADFIDGQFVFTTSRQPNAVEPEAEPAEIEASA
jgi:hypothetical protein